MDWDVRLVHTAGGGSMHDPDEPKHGPASHPEHSDIAERLTAIERRLAALEARQAAGRPSAGAPVPPPQAAPVTHGGHAFEVSERWLQRLGIALLLFGLAFLFKYSIDRAWLTPWVRVGIVMVAGGTLLALAWRFAGPRQLLARTLAGGGIACLYGAIFAAFELYHLVGYIPAFAGMLLVTAAAFALALGRIGVPMAALGTVGGFATPFVLYTDQENVTGLLFYAALLTLGGLGIYLRHRWRSLLWLTVIGAWSVVLGAFLASRHSVFGLPDPDALPPLRLAVIGFWLAFAMLPLRGWRQGVENAAETPLVMTTPVVGLIFCEQLWTLDDGRWAAIWGGVAIVYAGIAWAIRRLPLLCWLQMLVAVMLLAVGLWHVLGEDMLLLAVSSEAIVLMALARRLHSPWPRRMAHALFAASLYVVFWRLFQHPAHGIPFVNRQALTDLDVLGLAVIAAWLSGRSGRDLYAISVYAGLLALAYREFSGLTNGQAWVSAAWAMCGAALLIGALRSNHAGMRRLAMGTLVLVAAKLLLVDLSHIGAVWRILISAGLGAMFLLLSYVLPSLARRFSTTVQPERAAGGEEKEGLGNEEEQEPET
jgi:uncharacterized membrane protein